MEKNRFLLPIRLAVVLTMGAVVLLAGLGGQKPVGNVEASVVVSSDRLLEDLAVETVAGKSGAGVEPASVASRPAQPANVPVAEIPATAPTAGEGTGAAIAPPLGVTVRPVSSVVAREKPGDRIELEGARITNNVWGLLPSETIASGVYLNVNGTYGWYWDRPDQALNLLGLVKPIYPNVRIGGTPWLASTVAQFPVKVKDLKSLDLSLAYVYRSEPNGYYNLAYDLFLTDSSQPSASPNIKAEVMIWIQGTAEQKSLTYKGDYSDGYNIYQLHSWTMADGRIYYAFVMKERAGLAGSHFVDAKKLLEQLPLDPNWYIPGVELGNEVWHGSGRIEISKFDVRISSAY